MQDSTVSLSSSGALGFAAGITSPFLGGLAGDGNIALVTAASEAVALNVGGDGQNTTYSGAMSGAGGLVKVGNDTLTLAGATQSSYSGATLITSGVLQATHNSTTSPNSAVTISNGSTFDMSNTTQSIGSLSSTDGMGSQVLLGSGLLKIAGPGVTTFDGVMSGGGSATLQGGGLTLTGQNTFGGPMTVSGGALQLSSTAGPALAGNLQVSGGTATWLQSSQLNSSSNLGVSSGLANMGPYSDTVNNATITGGTIAATSGALTVNNAISAQSGTVNAVLAGPATLTKSGTAGTVVLGAANTYSGSTSIAAGTLILSNPLALQNTTASMNGGVLTFASGITSPTVVALSGSGNLALHDASNSAVTLKVGSNNAATTYSGIMSGSGGLLKQGAGTFQLANYQNYSGATNVTSGVLQLGPVTPLVPYTLGFNGNGTGWSVNTVNPAAGSGINSNVLTLTVDNSDASNQVTTAFDSTQVVVNKPFTVSFVYQGSNQYNYLTDGATFILQNSTSGLTALGGGSAGLGYSGITPSAGIGVNPFYNYYDGNSQLWLSGGSVASSFSTLPGITNYRDPIQVVLNYDGSNMMTTTWTDLNTSSTYSSSYAAGNLVTALGSTAAYIGFTGSTPDVNYGANNGTTTQTIGSFGFTYTAASAPFTGNNVLPTSTPLSVAAGATVDLFGGNDAIGSLSGAGTVTNSTAGSLSVLTVGNLAATQTFTGVLQDGGGSLGLGVVAPGGLVITGQNNTYSGPTTISGGTLQFGNGQSGNDGSITGAGGVIDNGLLVYNLFGSQTASYAITGNSNGAVTKTGPGTVTLSNGGNTYAGGTNVLQGKMVIAPGSNALPYGPLNVSGGSLDLEGNSPVVSTLSGSGIIGNGSSGTANLANLYVDPALSSASSTFSGTIRDGGFGGNSPVALNILNGTLSLSGTNDYSGGTYVFGGTLIATNPSAIEDNSNLFVGSGVPFGTIVAAGGSAVPAVGQGAASAVPEPGTLALLAAIGAAAAVVRAGPKRTVAETET